MAGWLARMLRPERPTRQALRVVPMRRGGLAARYDAASTSDENRRHWANADALSAAAAATPQVRRTLRNRARYEVANNSYAMGIVLTLANDSVGTGPRLQMQTEDPRGNAQVEQAFSDWAEAVDLATKLRTMRMAKTRDGEAFGLLTSNPRLRTPVTLDLRLVEADQVAAPFVGSGAGSLADGIVFDRFGNPSQYSLLRTHPGDLSGPGVFEADLIPASSVLHYFRPDRPGQVRGIPELAPSLGLFAQLRRYSAAVLAASEVAAEQALVIYTDAPPGGEADDLQGEKPFDAIALEKRMATLMPGGWKLGQVKAEQPTTTHDVFVNGKLNEIARCLLMPFNIAFGNSSGYNYASGRLDHQTYFKAIRVEQSVIEHVILDRLFASFLAEAILVEGLLPPSLRRRDARFDHQWFWDGHEHVDPLKEASAQAERLANHTTTLAEEYAKRGRDWEVELRQRAKEAALMRELGLRVAEPEVTPSADEDLEEEEAAANQDNGRRPRRFLESMQRGIMP